MMVSRAALSEALNLCVINNRHFSQIGERCFSYLETVDLLGALNGSEEIDDLFLCLVHAEIEEDDTVFELNEKVWAAAA